MDYQKEKMSVLSMEQRMVHLNALRMDATKVFENELWLADLMESVWVLLMEYQKENNSVSSMEQRMVHSSVLRMDATKVFENL